jgi:hypothetical protein
MIEDSLPLFFGWTELLFQDKPPESQENESAGENEHPCSTEFFLENKSHKPEHLVMHVPIGGGQSEGGDDARNKNDDHAQRQAADTRLQNPDDVLSFQFFSSSRLGFQSRGQGIIKAISLIHNIPRGAAPGESPAMKKEMTLPQLSPFSSSRLSCSARPSQESSP